MLIKTINSTEVLAIRHQVLWPGKPLEFCRLVNDSDGIHYGVYKQDKLVSVASIFIEGNKARLRKFATLHEYQSNGFGSSLIKRILIDLKNYKCNYFWCDARVSAINFYKTFYMSPFGDTFYKGDVEYIKMGKEI